MPSEPQAGRSPYETVSDRFLREPEVNRITGLSRTTRWRLEKQKLFPRRRQISANAVAWLESEVMTWMAEKAATAA